VSIVRARSFYHQEAAITWLFASPVEKHYIAHYLTVTLRSLGNTALHAMYMATVIIPGMWGNMTFNGIFYPRDLFARVLECEVEHRAVQKFQTELTVGAALDAVVGRDIPDPKWMN